MTPVRIGYVGAGYLAQRVHLPNLAGLAEVQLVALAEVRPKLAAQVAAAFRIPVVHPDHRALAADPNVEAVCVSGHFAGQGDLARDCLLAGKDVFMEKPMAVSVAQAERILEAERTSGRRLMVGYMKRHDAGNLEVRRIVDAWRASGEAGAVRFVRLHGFCGTWDAGIDTPFVSTGEPMPPGPGREAAPDWMDPAWYDRYVGYLQQYTHNVNLVRWLLDAGDRVTVTDVRLDERGYAGVVLLEVGGVRVSLESGNLAYHAWDEHTQVYFEKGWVRTEAPPLLLRNVCASVETYRDGVRTAVHPPAGWTWSYKEEMRQFALRLRSGEPFASPGTDALADVRVFEEIYRRLASRT